MSQTDPASVTGRPRTSMFWIVGLGLVALGVMWSARSVISHHRGAARDAQLLGILRGQINSVESASRNARRYVGNDNANSKSDFDADVASVRKNWELAQPLASEDGGLLAGLRQADEESQTVCAQLDLAMEARDKNKRQKGLNLLDSEQASQLAQAFNQTVSEMIGKETQALRRDTDQGRISEIAFLVCFVILVAGPVFRAMRGRLSVHQNP